MSDDELDETLCLMHTVCIRVNARRLYEAIEAGDWMRARLFVSYIEDDCDEVAGIGERLAPGAIPASAEDPQVLTVEEAPTLAEWSDVIDSQVPRGV